MPRPLTRLYVMVMLIAGGGLSLQTAAQPKPTENASWTLPRTSDGRPDLQGVWANNTATPLERPEALGDKARLSDEELARLRARYAQLFASGESDAAFADSVFVAALGEQGGFSSRDTTTGNYNQFWLVDREFDNRTSLIIEPTDGRLPPLTSQAQQHISARIDHLAEHPASSWTDRRLQERCITFGMPNLFAGYNTYYQIIQTPTHIVFLHEMIHDARIIPLSGTPHPDDSIRQWHGDSRGYWDGDTLVVETANFSAQSESPAPLYQRTRGSAEQLRLVERFSRSGPDTLQHQFTVEDPGTYTESWTAVIPLQRREEQLFEYACHEGNLGMEGILAGHRAEEQTATESGVTVR
ncbi:MAG: hypothetical protein VX453_15795 [Acidobacteriota bacterium]|nr:hypothetical protein [Acidobacteriota bacterium]